RNYRSGFLNRLAEELGRDTARAGAFTSELPLIMNGRMDIPNIHLSNNGRQGSPFNDRQKALLDAMYRNTPLKDRVDEGFTMRLATTDAIRQAIEGDDGKAVSAPGLKGDMRRIAIVMRDQFNI